MSLIRKILFILGVIVLSEWLLLFLPRTVEAACDSTWGCSPSCSSTLHCEWFPSGGGYGYCGNPDYGSFSSSCVGPGTYGGTYYPCGAVYVPGVEADCSRFGTDEDACINGYPNSGFRDCSVAPVATPTPTSPPSGPTNTPVPTATPTPTPTPLPCPSNFSVSCAGSGLQATINWDDLAGAVGYVLRVNKDPYGDWFGTGDIWKEPVNPSQTIDIISDTYYTYDVQGKKSGEAYPYSGARCPFDEFNCPAPTPTPTPYPTVAVSGNLKEYLDTSGGGGACYPNISTNTLSININPQIPAGVTAACGVTPPAGQTKSSYRCTVVFDNQSTPAQNLNLSSSATGYSSAYWTDANVCTNTANNSLPVDVSSGSSTVYDKDIFFNNSTAWIKLKNSSFSSSGSLTNVLPLNIAAYDSDDDASQRTRRDYRGVRLNNVTLKT